MGWQDEDGYIYPSGRRSDMMIVGGVNVFPAEIESVSNLHPQVISSCCVGLDDAESGKVPILAVQTKDGGIPEGFEQLLADGLSKNKRPHQLIAAQASLYDPAGKTRRSDIRSTYFSG
ncbi:hypothetical protein NQ036_14325 [Brevibacterium sp. 91QC2O2]|uniref:AMP-binding enzyme n=1 Tax=Brevibacterium TaxID=1696 RepID=UPI00211C4B3F|nr:MULTISPECIES: hypothetical protein [unclassified Brevibacterium]MCQ9369410.1 hypothetical protein [Brevibacterium sp. 91QC2O2]MCQ9387014.1 hypothetical protein [Brevibacterium sp. 68QC2CO]